MGNVKIFQRMRRRLTKNSSGTISVSIPLEHTYELGWNQGDYVQVERQGKQIIISLLNVEGDKK